jgi:hypothetical protein
MNRTPANMRKHVLRTRRVNHIYNRGLDFSKPNHRDSPSPNPVAIDIEAIRNSLDSAQQDCSLEHEKWFIPTDKLSHILSFETISSIVCSLACFRNVPNKKDVSHNIFYGPRGNHKYRCVALLGALIGIGKENDLQRCMDEGMTDECLPLKRERSTRSGDIELKCRHRIQHSLSTVNKYRKDTRRHISQWSYGLTSPLIFSSRDKHSHYHLDAGDVFPMKSVKKVEKDPIIHTQDPNNENVASGSDVQYGGFSEVYKVNLLRSHYDFGDYGVSQHNDALRRLLQIYNMPMSGRRLKPL